MTALPTSPALDAAVAELVTKVAPWCKIGEALTAIRRLQDHATLDALGRVPTVTLAKNAPVVFDIDEFRRSRTMVHHDDDGPEAA